ncbi:MAG TPA: AAA family ATPase [Caulobacteraceae bacterium]|nr:AAA family ATPase [Caulobacteraceae bacterium]
MQFQKLRLSGFKSFVEPTEFRIEPGLTGVVGPNGCGKSNLLEALRWVMGANSAKAMRAGGMDDVIFAGAGARPTRNHAEVTLHIDNADRTAPAEFNDHPLIEVSRRIDKGEGSTYRVNGREVRARDVQLLFADASTGANSPALVRQGQISELIAAKPQNRRMILEEAAGVSGLHTRRHEADLRLRAAEANLLRLDDVTRELESALGRLRREARAAEKYKRLAAEIRMVQSAVLLSRWREAEDAGRRAQSEAAEAAVAVEQTARAAAEAATAAATASEALKPLREEEAVAAAVLHRLAIEKDRLEREAELAAAEVKRLNEALARIGADRAREAQLIEDAEAALSRLSHEIAALQSEIAAAPEHLPHLQAAADAAEAARAKAEAEVEQLAAAAAAEEAGRRAAQTRLDEARARLARTVRALDAAKGDRAALGPAEDPRLADAKTRFDAALEALRKARAAQEKAEQEQAAAQGAEAKAREAARKAEDQLNRLKAEARGLAQLAAPAPRGGFARASDAIQPQRGYEAALAAALGDDVDAALDPKAPAFWGGAEAPPGAGWPAGAEPLAPLIKAPPALAARLALTGLVARADGDRLQKLLPVGARLVSKEGDLWRWDGFVARAEAPRPAAVRLAQKARLADLENEIDALAPAAAAAAAAQKAAVAALQGADQAVREARKGPPEAERELGRAREALDGLTREGARRDARAQSLDETIARFEEERAEAEGALQVAEEAAVQATASDGLGPRLTEARQASAVAREAASSARSALDVERRLREGRKSRLETLGADQADWTRRSAGAAKRTETLAQEAAKTEKALAVAREAPQAISGRTLKLMDELVVAEARRAKAGDALAAAERALAEADRTARAADHAASEARERRGAMQARLEAGLTRLAEVGGDIREATGLEPDQLARRLTEEAAAVPADPAGVEAHLRALERERDALGLVNLRAEDEAKEYAERLQGLLTERADLDGAVARLRQGIEELNAEGRDRLLAAFDVINGHFQTLFQTLFGGGQAELRLVESDDPLEAGLEIFACPPGKRLSTMSLMSGGEQALTAAALIFGVFLANPAPVCVLDEVDAPLDDANVDRFCAMLNQMRERTQTRFIAITHNPVTMARMDRLFGVTMPERGVSQLVSVDLRQAEALVAQSVDAPSI